MLWGIPFYGGGGQSLFPECCDSDMVVKTKALPHPYTPLAEMDRYRVTCTHCADFFPFHLKDCTIYSCTTSKEQCGKLLIHN